MDASLRTLLIVAELSTAWGIFAWFLFARHPLGPVARVYRLLKAPRNRL